MLCILLLSFSASYALRVNPVSPSTVDAKLDGAASNAKALEWLAKEANSDFPDMPSTTAGLHVKTPEDACKADLLMFTSEAGMGSQINNLMNLLAAASYGNFSVALLAKTPITSLMQKNFQQKLSICNAEKTKHTGALPLYDAVGSFVAKLTKKNRSLLRNLKYSVYDEYYQLNEESKNQVAQNLEAMGVPVGTKYTGVHIRHGDKTAAEAGGNTQTTKYGDAIQKLNLRDEEGEQDMQVDSVVSTLTKLKESVKEIVEQETEFNTVYVASDDKAAHRVLTSHLGTKYNLKGLHAKGSGADHSYDDSDTMMAVLTDIEALRNSEIFIGTATSNFDRMIYFLRPASKKSITLDDGGDWLRRNGDGKRLVRQ